MQSKTTLLQRARDSRHCAEEVSGSLGRRTWVCCRSSAPGRTPRPGGRVVAHKPPMGASLLATGAPPDDTVVPGSLQARQPHLSVRCRKAWLALGADPWVLSTKTHGYHLQFRSRPRVMRVPTFTSVNNILHTQTLRADLSTLLEKGAIREVKRSVRVLLPFFSCPQAHGGSSSCSRPQGSQQAPSSRGAGSSWF